MTGTQKSHRRNWIVVLDVVDDDRYEYGPYTEAAAKQAVQRIERWIDRVGNEEGEMHVGSFPIHKWGRADEDHISEVAL